MRDRSFLYNTSHLIVIHTKSSCFFLYYYTALTYEVYILTGDCRGAGTEADIKLTLFGDYGTSGERPLLKSMNHPRKFRRGQVTN